MTTNDNLALLTYNIQMFFVCLSPPYMMNKNLENDGFSLFDLYGDLNDPFAFIEYLVDLFNDGKDILEMYDNEICNNVYSNFNNYITSFMESFKILNENQKFIYERLLNIEYLLLNHT